MGQATHKNKKKFKRFIIFTWKIWNNPSRFNDFVKFDKFKKIEFSKNPLTAKTLSSRLILSQNSTRQAKTRPAHNLLYSLSIS
jgi:hypothetical protein